MAAVVEKTLLVVLDLLARLLFALYWVLPYLGLAALVALLASLSSAPWAADVAPALARRQPWLLVAMLLLALWASRRQAARDNPHRRYPGAIGWLDARIDGLFAWIGTLKYFRSPLCMVEDPGSYRIRGEQVRALIDGVLQPGDILLRGFDGYIDGLLIRRSGGAQAASAHFSHAAIYLGDLDDAVDRPIAARRLQVADDDGQWREATDAQKDAVRADSRYYQSGRQKIIHSMTRGVFVEDILTFLRCDHLAVLRLTDDPIRFDATTIAHAADTQLIHDLSGEGLALHQRLMRGEAVPRAEVLAAVHRSALGKIGSCYDFQFNAVKTAHVFSCSEFVYYCFKSIHCHLGLLPKKHAFLDRFFARETITPGDIFDTTQPTPKQQARMAVVWSSTP